MNNIYGYVMILAAFVNAISQVLLKKSADETSTASVKQKFMNIKVLISYAIFGLVCLVNLVAYRGIDFKYGGIIQMLGQIFVIVLARIFCGEALSKRKMCSLFLISAGIIVYNL